MRGAQIAAFGSLKQPPDSGEFSVALARLSLLAHA
jgi:hypothetical protein